MPALPKVTKTGRPRAEGAARRTRLFALLDLSRDGPVTWVSGPPGAGKTTLVASWIEARHLPCLWYEVDEQDADLATFFHYLSVAAKPYLKRSRQSAAFLPEYSAAPLAYARRFFRALLDNLPDDAVLVFDNAHLVPESALLHRVISEVVAQMPARSSVVMISQSAPPAEFAGLILNGRLRQIEAASLELTLGEAKEIASGMHVLDDATVSRLHRLTQGWFAGFRMALSGQGIRELDRSDSDTRRVVYEYFATQIYRSLPESSQKLLLVASLLPAIDPSLCEQLLPGCKSQQTLEQLRRTHRFVERIDGSPTRYRLHPLFRDFLQTRMAEDLRDFANDIRSSAAQLLERSGDGIGAFELYVLEKAWDDAIRAILREAPLLLARGRWQAFDTALGQLPEAMVEASAPIAFWQGQSRLSLDPWAAEARLARAFDLYGNAGDDAGQLVAAAAACVAIFFAAERFDRLDAWFDRMVPLMLSGQSPAPQGTNAVLVYTGAIIALTRRPAHPLASRCATTLTSLIDEPVDVNLRITAAAALMLFLCYTGDIHGGRRLEAAIEPHLENPDLAPLNAGFWHVYLGYLSVVEHTPSRGHPALDKADEIAEREGFGYLLTVSYSLRSALYHVGDEAEAMLARVEPSMAGARPYDVAHFLGNRLYRAVLRGQWEASLEYGLQTLDYTRRTGSVFQQLIWEQPLAWAFAELGRWDDARGHLESVATLVKTTGSECYRPLLLLTAARVSYLEGDRPRYLELLRDGLAAARTSYGAQRLLFWMPATVAPQMMADALDHGIDPPLVRTVIRDYPLEPPSPVPEQWPFEIDVRTLGGFELRISGEPITFSHKTPHKTLSLLKAVIALGSSNVPKHRLIDSLWPDEEGDAANRSFDVAIHRLRKILGRADAISVDSNTVSLNRRIVRTDVRVFTETADEVVVETDFRRRHKLASKAIQMFDLGFLPSDATEPWSVSMRERLRSRAVALVEIVATALEADEAWEEALDWYRRAVAVDPLGETFHQGLMRAHLKLGRHAEGLAAYSRLRAALRAELGIEPSARSEDLHLKLRNGAKAIQ